jgi:general secretion pathway protein D
MRERQEFVEQFYGASNRYDVAIDFERKPGPLARMGQIINKEMNRLENGGPGEPGQKLIQPIVPANPNTGGASSPEPGENTTPPPSVPVQEPNPETLKVQPPEIN